VYINSAQSFSLNPHPRIQGVHVGVRRFQNWDNHPEEFRIATTDRKSIKLPDRYQANLVEYDEPSSYEEAVTAEDTKDWKRAIHEELQAHELKGTWIFENLPEGRKAFGSKWVFKKKYITHISTHKYKARLCAKGFAQKQRIDYQEVFAPVARYDSIRTILAIAVQKNMEIGQFDVKTAFLNGDLIEKIYIEIPKEVTT